jgi:hypothetical protein
VEVGSGGVAGLAREVYGLGGGGELTQAEMEEREEFETRLKRSLGVVGVVERAREEGMVDGAADVDEGPRRSSRRAAEDTSDEEDEDSDSD